MDLKQHAVGINNEQKYSNLCKFVQVISFNHYFNLNNPLVLVISLMLHSSPMKSFSLSQVYLCLFSLFPLTRTITGVSPLLSVQVICH